MNYTTYERPIDLYNDCEEYFIGIIQNNPDKDYIVYRSGYSTNTLVIGKFKYNSHQYSGKADFIIYYSGYRNSQEQYNIVKGGVDDAFTLTETDKLFAFSNVSRETSCLQGVQVSQIQYKTFVLFTGLLFVGILFCQLCKHRSSSRGKTKYY